jgi:hypothetical protein
VHSDENRLRHSGDGETDTTGDIAKIARMRCERLSHGTENLLV